MEIEIVFYIFSLGSYMFLLSQVATVQGLSGTGSLRLAAALIERYLPGAKVLISSPTWGACNIITLFLF